MLTLMRRQWLSHRHDFSGPCPLRDWTLLSRSVARLTTSPTRCRSTLASLSSRLGPEPSAVGYNDYEAERRTFKLDQPQFYNFASDVIDRWAHTEQTSDVRGSLPAFWWVSGDGDELKWSFTELADKSKRVANMLTGPCRMSRGEPVVVLLPKLPQWWLLNIACARAGVVMVPSPPQLTAKDISYRLNSSQAKCVFVDSMAADKLDKVISDCPSVQTKVVVNAQRPGWFEFNELFEQCSNEFETVRTLSTDISQMFFTSGTTGYPKMTQLSCASYGLGHSITAKYWMDLTATDVQWCMSDPGWAKSAWGNVFSPWINGACVFIHSMPRMDPQLVLQTLEKYPITVYCSPATGFRMLLRNNPDQYKFKTLRHCISGGEPVDANMVEQWLDSTGRVIREGYGQTETVLLCCTPRCLPVRIGSLGKPAPGMDVTIVDADGREVGPNVEGEIALRVKPHRPVGLFTSYYNDSERTESVFRGDFYMTGDSARRDDDGYFWFAARVDDVINSAGYRIGPHEVECALMDHPAVSDAAVVSSPDPLRGEVVKAFVVLSAEYEARHDREQLVAELQKHVQISTAPYKYPRKMEFVESLPKTDSGKTRRSVLRKNEWSKSNA